MAIDHLRNIKPQHKCTENAQTINPVCTHPIQGALHFTSFLTSSPKFTHCLRFPLPCLPRGAGGAHAPCRMKSRRRPGGQGRRRLGSRGHCGIRTQRQSPMYLRVGAWGHQGPNRTRPEMELPMEDLLRTGDCPRHTPIAGGGGSCGSSSHCSRSAAGEKLGFKRPRKG